MLSEHTLDQLRSISYKTFYKIFLLYTRYGTGQVTFLLGTITYYYNITKCVCRVLL